LVTILGLSRQLRRVDAISVKMSYHHERRDESYWAYTQGTSARNLDELLIFNDSADDSNNVGTHSDPRTPRTITPPVAYAPEPADETFFSDDASDSDCTIVSTAWSHAPTSSSQSSYTFSRPHSPVIAPAQVQVGQEEHSFHGIRIPCEFSSVSKCQETFDAYEENEAWVYHHLDHLETDQPPRTRCTFCGTGEVFDDFWQRMDHICQHWLNGEARRRVPDINLLKYMRDRKIITKAAFESELEQLPLAPPHVLAALQCQQKEKGEKLDPRKEDRQRRKHNGGQSSSSHHGHHGHHGRKAHRSHD
jgi:hypothetical protein